MRNGYKKYFYFNILCFFAILALSGCCPNKEDLAKKNFPTSLHGKFQGMRTFYEASKGDEHFSGSDGYGHIIGVAYDDIGCGACHDSTKELPADPCLKCHATGNYSDQIPNETCLGCHSRQASEIAMGIEDVHNAKKQHCVDCHTWNEMHGDGTNYDSMWAEGAHEATCESCHTGDDAEGPAVESGHDMHGGKLHCSACHVKTVITCYNCHFDSEVDGTGKIAHKKLGGSGDKSWLLLVNHNGQVRSGSFQSVVYQGKNTFIAFGPYHAHSVAKEARTCAECHNNAAMQQLAAQGKIIFAKWDEETKSVIQQTTGAIPLIDGKLDFAFVDLDDPAAATKTWSFISEGVPENSQYGYCTPLTDTQLGKLQMSMGSLKQYIIRNNLLERYSEKALKMMD